MAGEVMAMQTTCSKSWALNIELKVKAASRRLSWIFGFFLTFCVVPVAGAQLKQYETKYYTIYTDIDPDGEKEAAIRMTRMAEEYHERTKGFAGVIREKLPFYLFKSKADYLAAGGMKGSSGVFVYNGTRGKLMAIAGEKVGQGTWHVVQHEGFHQFAHAVIGGDIPIWLNEGLAEYFGESIFTGDGFVTGVVPPWREQRLKDEINGAEIKPLIEMMQVTPRRWAMEMDIKNYDQAWSMVHFLVHGDDAKYQDAFGRCIAEISTGKPFARAWQDTLGPPDEFQARWKSWWLSQPKSPTRILYARAAVATMTSYVARAWTQKQTFSSFDEFKSAVDAGTLKISDNDWLPPALIQNTVRLYGSLPGWEISPGVNKQPTVSLTLPDVSGVIGSFTLRGQMIDQVNVTVDDLPSVLKDAQTQAQAGRKTVARTMVQSALRQNPTSPAAIDARKFLQSLR